MKIQNAFPVFGHLATVWTSRLTAFAYLPSSSQVGGQVWMSQGPSLDFSLTCGEQLTCFRQLCFQQHVMSLSCTYLEALSSFSFKCSNKMSHKTFLRTISSRYLSCIVPTFEIPCSYKQCSYDPALLGWCKRQQPRVSLEQNTACTRNAALCTKYVHHEHAPSMRTKYVH